MQLMLLTAVFLFFLLSGNTVAQTLYPTSAGGVGAVYTMSNAGDINQILIHRLTATGALSMVSAIDTNGTGVSVTRADPLVSQGAMAVYSNYLFSVNAGSNSLSMFMISPSDATQLTLLSIQSTNGWFPVSVTVNNMYACVVTGGNITGIRCFTYNSSGLFLVSSFDRNLTAYISQTVPPTGPPQTISQISFSADNLALIVSIKGIDTTTPGYLLFYLFTNNRMTLSSNAVRVTPTSAILPFSMTLVGSEGLLITDPGANGVLTLTYSSLNGSISNSMFTPVNTSLAAGLCWSTYSPTLDSYYVVGTETSTIAELLLNLTSTSSPVQITQYFSLPNNTGALETTVVTLAGKDYLYVIGIMAHVISGYQLNAVGNATANTIAVSQSGNTTDLPKLAGIAAFIQTQSSSTASFLAPTITIMLYTVFIVFDSE